ncbi:MAG: glycosyltransferase [Alkalispirochaeta sp.]
MRTIAVVIPSHNGSQELSDLLPQLERVLSDLGDAEIIVVDDGSTAAEAAVLRSLAESHPQLRLIRLETRTGQIHATLVGVSLAQAEAQAEIVITMDDDGGHPPEVIPRMVALLRADQDLQLVYAAPGEQGTGESTRTTARPLIRRIGTSLNNRLFHRYLNLPAHVPVGSFRAIRRDLLGRALARPIRYPYLSAMLLSLRPAVACVRYTPPPAPPRTSKSRHAVRRLVSIWIALTVYWGPLKPVGRLLRRPRPAVQLRERPALMILGGGSSQISVLRRARERGFSVILADQDPAAPGRDFADRFEQASTFDVDAVTAAAERSGAQAILAVGSDQPVYTAAAVSHRLGLPYPLSTGQAREVTNKAEMKPTLHAAGVPLVPWALLGSDPSRWDSEGLADLTLPWVVKPVDSQGQRGIRIVESKEELEAHRPVALSFSRDHRILVEEYYPSQEITVSGWARRRGQHGGAQTERVEVWTITDRVTFEPSVSVGVCLAHRFPSEAARGREAEIKDITARIVEALHLEDVPIYFQMLVGERGVLVNEIACRLGGAYEDQSIPLVTGIDILDRQLQWYRRALGSDSAGDSDTTISTNAPEAGVFDDAPRRPHSRAFAVPLMFCRPGTVVRMVGAEELLQHKGVAACRFLLPPGTEIKAMSNSTQRIAYAVLHANDAGTINTLVDTVFDTLRAEDSAGENLLIDTREETKRRYAVE